MNLVFQAVISTIARIKLEMKTILVMADECGESFNFAVNAVADVLHTLTTRYTKNSAAISAAMVRSR